MRKTLSAILAGAAVALSAAACSPSPAQNAASAPVPATQPTTTAPSPTAQLGRWVASCTDSSVDEKRLEKDLSAGAPALLHAQSLEDEPAHSQALAAISPLTACTDSYIHDYLARELPAAWETAGAQRFAVLISMTSRKSPTPSPSQDRPCPNCNVTATLSFNHPTWGPVKLETYSEKPLPSTARSGYRVVSQSDGRVLFDKPIDDMLYNLSIEPRTADGFIFITYNPGRYNGVIVLRPTKDGFEDFGTDSYPDNYGGRFYNAKVEFGSSPAFTIIRTVNDCNPSCASGTLTDTKFVYDPQLNDLVPS